MFDQLQAGIGDGPSGILSHVRKLVNDFFHVTVLFFDDQLSTAIGKVSHYFIYNGLDEILFYFELGCVKISDDKLYGGTFRTSFYVDRMDKALSA